MFKRKCRVRVKKNRKKKKQKSNVPYIQDKSYKVSLHTVPKRSYLKKELQSLLLIICCIQVVDNVWKKKSEK